MAKVLVSDLKPGMVCSEPVKRGAVMVVHAGMELSEELIGYLQQWEIDSVEIFDGKMEDVESVYDSLGDEGGENIDSQAFEDAAVHFFKHTDIEHPAIEILFGEYLTRLVMAQVAPADDAE